MQDLKQLQMSQDQEHATETQPAYIQPKIKVYKEEDMLKTMTVLGCSLQAGGDGGF
jgi:hypothetical protein